MKSLNLKRLTIGLILITIFLLYIFFLFLDLDSIYKGNISNKVKYISILLCFILSLIIYEDSLNFKDTILLQLGLLFTSLADLFFLLFVISMFALTILLAVLTSTASFLTNTKLLVVFSYGFFIFLPSFSWL